MYQRIQQAIVRRMASSHPAGPNFSDAVKIYHIAEERGWLCAFGLWADPGAAPKKTVQDYMDALQTIIGQSLKCYLSVKLTTLHYEFELFKDLVELAHSANIRIHLDAMDPGSVPPTLKTIERILATHNNLGYSIPSRWHRSVDDIERIIEWGIPVRLIKGQWSDPAAVKPDVRNNFLKIVNRLAGRHQNVAIATHDRHLASEAIQTLKDANTPCEMEQMYGLPQNCASLAKSLNVPLRIYIPYGFPSLPYNIRYIQTRPAIVGWAIRDFILGSRKHLSR
jgi:proline dehydrogenase